MRTHNQKRKLKANSVRLSMSALVHTFFKIEKCTHLFFFSLLQIQKKKKQQHWLRISSPFWHLQALSGDDGVNVTMTSSRKVDSCVVGAYSSYAVVLTGSLSFLCFLTSSLFLRSASYW